VSDEQITEKMGEQETNFINGDYIFRKDNQGQVDHLINGTHLRPLHGFLWCDWLFLFILESKWSWRTEKRFVHCTFITRRLKSCTIITIIW